MIVIICYAFPIGPPFAQKAQSELKGLAWEHTSRAPPRAKREGRVPFLMFYSTPGAALLRVVLRKTGVHPLISVRVFRHDPGLPTLPHPPHHKNAATAPQKRTGTHD